MRINFDFNDLEAFLAVLEEGSFHKAGERLGLSQPAVTRRIQKLEQELDSVLFERTTRDIRPTLAAKRLRARAEAILEDIRETATSLRDESVVFAHQRNAVVTVAAIPTVIGRLIPKAMTLFRDAGQEARLRIIDVAANDVGEVVAQGEADFGIGFTPSRERNIEFEVLFDDQIVLAFHPDHPFAARAGIHWRDLKDQALIMPARGTGNRLLIDDALAKARLPLSWSFEAGRTTTSLELAAAGTGVALLPRSVLMSNAAGDVQFQLLRDPEVSRPIGLISRLSARDRPVVSHLKTALRATITPNR